MKLDKAVTSSITDYRTHTVAIHAGRGVVSIGYHEVDADGNVVGEDTCVLPVDDYHAAMAKGKDHAEGLDLALQAGVAYADAQAAALAARQAAEAKDRAKAVAAAKSNVGAK
jgi:hypothetical protein